jgi:hypothetical protein
MNISDQQAFPATYSGENGITSSGGLTKREYYAGLAMHGMISAMDGFDATPGFMEHLAVSAVKQADALIKALEATKPNNQ